jgi:hypothetical protein
MVTTGTLISALTDGTLGSRGWLLAVVFGAHVLGFTILMWKPPWPIAAKVSDSSDP